MSELQLENRSENISELDESQEIYTEEKESQTHQFSETIPPNVIVYKKNIPACIFLSLITLGIYTLYWISLLIKNSLILSGKKTTIWACTRELLCFVFIPFYSLYWWYTRGNELNEVFAKQNNSPNFIGISLCVLDLITLHLVPLAIMQYEINKLNVKSHRDSNGYIGISIVIGILFVLGITLFPVSEWYKANYAGVDFKTLLYVLTGPKEGTDGGMVGSIISAAIPYTLTAAAIYVEAVILLANRRKICKYLRGALCLVCAATLVYSLVFTADAIQFDADSFEKTEIYENYYVDPNTVAINANGKTKNLIYIYLESMETTHLSKEYGGDHDYNYIPGLTQLALNNINFSTYEQGKVGGFIPVPGTGWTMAALLCTTSGVPFAFSIEGNNNMDKREEFAPGLTTLGDILEAKGYKSMFLCGSDGTFGGRQKYFTQHGNYEIYDLNTARSEGKLPNPLYHNGFWGFEDHYLYDIAKEQLTELAKGDKPFNFTMLTVDTHPREGYICSLCENKHDNITGNVLECADRQVTEFVEWIQQQDFYEDSVIVISGDHLRMDLALVPDPYYGRRVYNCYINSAIEPSGQTYGREFTTCDIFPTTLAAMGFEIEGNRLGLGTNMFSGERTLIEELGYGYLDTELKKDSDYYFYNFEHPELKQEQDEDK